MKIKREYAKRRYIEAQYIEDRIQLYLRPNENSPHPESRAYATALHEVLDLIKEAPSQELMVCDVKYMNDEETECYNCLIKPEGLD